MQLSEDESHIWYFDIESVSNEIEFYKGFLSSEEIAKADRFKFTKDKTISILARGALRILSGRYLHLSPNTIKFRYGKYGKPDYGFPVPLKFNISHSGNLIVIAFVKNCQLGVDIERIRQDFNVLDIAEKFFSDMEIKMLHDVQQDDVYKAFYRCWTRKESFIKAKGSGLSFPLARFTVSLNDNEAKLLKTEWNPAEKEKWKLFSFEPASGYVGALSIGANIQKVIYHNWTGIN